MHRREINGLIILSLVFLVGCEYIPPGPRYVCPERKENIFPCKCLKGTDDGLYIHCENTNLATLSVAFNNIISAKSPIEEMVISKSHFSHLYGTLFYKLKIRKLFIEDTPLERIDDLLFRGVNRTLQELHILKTNLNEFPKNAFKILGNLTILKIDHHRIESLDKDIFSESAANEKLERLHISNGLISELMPESFQTLRKLKTLDIHGNRISTLKRNQFKNLRDVEILDISFNNITKLDSSHIADLTKMGWCNVSHNALNELTRGTFARNSVLKLLNMSHNKIKRLDINSFRGMRFLRRLFLNDNNITEIGRGTFGSITRIGTIDLARNQIKKIDYQMFAQLNYVEIIDVSENSVTEVQKQSFKDLFLTNINLSRNMITKFEGNSFENCANITVLDLSHNLIQNLPKNTFDETTYATEFKLSYNQFTNLSQIPLHNMTGLKLLNLSHNEITDIPRNTFPKLYELHTIDLSHNNLSTIANAVFQTLFSLRNLNLTYNSLENIRSSVFGTVPTLLDMNLSNNQLKTIAKGALTKLSSLRHLTLENNKLNSFFEIPISLNHLNLRYNEITELPAMTWPSMNAMLTLDLTGNRLEDNLFGESFRNLLTLQKLNLNNNGITKVPWESLSVLSTLQYVYLENNNITSLSKGAFGKLPVVFEVNLYNNQISNVSDRAFDGLLQLLTLNLSSNAIETLDMGAFMGLVSLQDMDLSHNFIEKLDNKSNGVLDNCLSLRKINLSYNKISFVTIKTFPSDPYIPYRLEDIDLSHNEMPVLTYDITVGAKKAKRLNLSHNYINEIRKNVLGNLSSVEVLDLSYNDLDDLNPEKHPITFPENLTELYLSGNRLVELPDDKIANLTKLNVLDISHNRMEVFNYTLLNKIKHGLSLLINDNPVLCNCNIRPLKHYLSTLLDIPSIYSSIKCDLPTHLRGHNLLDVSDDSLQCSKFESEQKSEIDDFSLLPDIRFREIYYFKDKLINQWYVAAPSEDIADFYMSIRDSSNQLLTENRLAYDNRVFQINGNDITSDYDGQLELCILAKKSNGELRPWFDSQCIQLPENFDSVKRTYTSSKNQPFIIHSVRKGVQARTAINKNPPTLTKRKKSANSSARKIPIANTLLLISLTYLAIFRLKFQCS